MLFFRASVRNRSVSINFKSEFVDRAKIRDTIFKKYFNKRDQLSKISSSILSPTAEKNFLTISDIPLCFSDLLKIALIS